MSQLKAKVNRLRRLCQALLASVVFSTRLVWPASASAAQYPLSYSGRLVDEYGGPLAGPVDLQVQFYRQAQDGAGLLTQALSLPGVELSAGLFQLDLGLSDADVEVLFADTRLSVWIEVSKKDADGQYRAMPRQRYSYVPYALKALSANSVPVDGTTVGFDAATGKLKLLTSTWGSPGMGKFLTTDASGGLVWGTPSGGAGSGDMLESTYDSNSDNKVDVANNAESLAGQPAAYYSNAANLTGMVAYARLPVGTAANTIAAGDDARFNNARTPSGPAGGDLSGSYPNPTLKSSASDDAARPVTSDHIKDSTVTSTKLAADAVTMAKLAANAVNSSKIADASIVDADIASTAAIADSKLATIATPGKVSGDAITAGTLVGTSGFAGSSGVSLKSAGAVNSLLRFYDAINNNFVGFKAPSTLAGNTIWQLPAAGGSSGQVLSTDNTNQLSWITPTQGTVTAVTAGTGLTGGTITTSGTLALTSPMPALDGAALTNINAVKLQNRNVSNTAPSAGQILKWIDNTWTPAADAGDSASSINGGINIGSDSASNAGILAAVEANNLRFRRLTEGSGIDVVQNSDDVTIAIASGGVGGTALADSAVSSSKIADDSIVNADIASTAAIADSKLATIATPGKVSGSAITSGTVGGTSQFAGSGGIDTTGAISTTASPISGYGNFVLKASSTATTELKFNARNNSDYTSFKSPDTVAGTMTYTLPAGAPAADGQVLSATTSGALSWLSLPTLANLLPSQTGHSGKVLQTDGSAASWVVIPSAPVSSVAGKTGTVTLNADDVVATASKLWLSDTDKAKLDGIAAGANMLTSIYDSTSNNKVDIAEDAEKLDGQLPSYYRNASNMTTGTLPVDQVPNLDAAKITTGSLAYALLPVGTAANTVAAGDDARFSNARMPTGTAGGDLTGSYPNPTLKSSASDDTARPVTGDHIKDSAITSVKLAVEAVTAATLAANAVSSSKIADDSIVDADIASTAAIADSKLATIATPGKVSGAAITSGTIAGTSQFAGSGGIDTTGAISTTASPISGYGNFVLKASSTATTELKFNARNNSDYTSFKAPDTVSGTMTYTLPAAAPAADGQVLSATISGALSWLSLPTLANLLPSQTGHSGKVLQTDGSAASWVAISSAPVSSVAGKTGVVTLNADDVAATTSKLWLSNTDKAKLDGITAGANMLTSTYDSDNNGAADNADQLGGQLPAYYSNASNITTGTLPVAQVPNLDAAKITTGTLAYARLPVGTAASTIASGDDTRFTDARIPTGPASGDLTGNYPDPALTTTGVIAGIYAKVTVDAKGRVTDGISTIGSSEIADDAITNADINATAAIADTKLATISTPGKVSGGAITVGTIAGTTALNTSGDLITTGLVGIGTTTPLAKLDINGQAYSRSYDAGSATTIDFNNGNNQITSTDTAAITLSNMVDGGTYLLVCSGSAAVTHTFTHDGLSFLYWPANGPTTAGRSTLYSMVRIASTVYVTWISGFQ